MQYKRICAQFQCERLISGKVSRKTILSFAIVDKVFLFCASRISGNQLFTSEATPFHPVVTVQFCYPKSFYTWMDAIGRAPVHYGIVFHAIDIIFPHFPDLMRVG
jgi:hypothetical protein